MDDIKWAIGYLEAGPHSPHFHAEGVLCFNCPNAQYRRAVEIVKANILREGTMRVDLWPQEPKEGGDRG